LLLNKKYYKPADELFKIFEEYFRQNAIFLLRYFRDAHTCLVKVTSVKDVVSRKKVIDEHLEKYVKTLKMILIGDYAMLIFVRIKDLLKAPLLPNNKKSISVELNPKWEEYKKREPLKYNNDKTIVSVNYTYNNAIEELDEAIGFFKETYEFIEKIHKKYI